MSNAVDGLAKVTDADFRSALRRAEHASDVELRLAERARKSPSAFVQFVMRRERFPKTEIAEAKRTGKRLSYLVQLADIQLEMIDFLLEHERVVVRAAPEMGKSQIATIMLSLWLAGQDLRGFTCKLSSLNSDFAKVFSRSIAAYVESSRALRLVYPDMVPGEKWSEGERYLVRPADSIVKDPHWLAIGAEGPQQGKRVDLDIGDDIQDQKSTSTEYLSDKTLKWWRDGESRMLAGARRWVICNAHESYDMGHKLVKEDGYKLFMLAARDRKGKTTLPVIWPQDRVDRYPEGLKKKHLDADADTPGDKAFKPAYVERCKRQGRGLTLMEATRNTMLPGDVRVLIGVDLMHGKHNQDKALRGRKKKTDDTVFHVALAGSRPAFVAMFPVLGDRLPHVMAEFIMPIGSRRAKLENPEVKGWIVEHDERHPGAVFVIEDNGAQGFVQQDLRITHLAGRLIPFHTGAYKHDPTDGVPGINTDMSEGLYIIPCEEQPDGSLVCEPEIQNWIDEMLAYQRGSHSGDNLMASFFIRNVVRRLAGTDGAAPRVAHISMTGQTRAEALVQGGPAAGHVVAPWMAVLGRHAPAKSRTATEKVDREVRDRFKL